MSACNPVDPTPQEFTPSELLHADDILPNNRFSQLCASGATVSQIRKVFEEQFIQDCGALDITDTAESSIPEVYATITLIQSFNNKLRYLPWDSCFSFSSLIKAPVLVIPLYGKMAVYQNIAAIQVYKRDYCNKESCNQQYHMDIYNHIFRLSKKNELIYWKFLNNPLDEQEPLQDLRNRCRRVMVMENQKKIFSIWVGYHFLQREALKLQDNSTIMLTGPFKSIEFPEYEYINFNRFVTEKTHVFSERGIQFLGKFRWVKITGEFLQKRKSEKLGLEEEFDIHTVIAIRDFLTNECLGSIAFHKTWRAIGEESDTNFCYIDTINEKTYLEPEKIIPHAIIGNQIYLSNQSSEANGNLPVLKLIAQIAVEILLREPGFDRIDIKSTSNLGGVFHAGGFGGSRYDGATLFALNRARENKKLFIPIETQPSHTLKLEKKSLFSSTKLVSRDLFGESSAAVSFSLEEKYTRWEEIINGPPGPILGRGSGPVLPRYHFRDLTHVSV